MASLLSHRYAIPILGAGLATLLAALAGPLFPDTPVGIFIIPVALSAWRGGLGPGLLTMALGLVGLAVTVSPQIASGEVGPAVISLVRLLVAGSLITLLVAYLSREVARWRHAERALRLAYDELQATQADLARLAAIVEATPDLVAIADAESRPVYLNPAGQQLLGVRSHTDLSGGRLDGNRPDWARDQHTREVLPAVHAQGSWTGESAYRAADGRDVPVLEVVLAHRAPDGTITHFSTIARDITARKRVEQEREQRAQSLSAENVMLYQRATTDTLTGLANRDHALELLDRLISMARRQERRLTFAFLDVDHFKQVNDRYGHAVGDQVLHQLGALLGVSFRGEDVVARWGGEEFLVGLFGADKPQAVARLTRVLGDFRTYPFATQDGTEFHVSCSAGVAEYPTDGVDSAALHLAADQALYRAKAEGRDRIVTVGQPKNTEP